MAGCGRSTRSTKRMRWRRRRASDARPGGGGGARRAGWHSDRAEGRDRGRGPAADRVQPDARELRLALRRHRHDPAEERGGRAAGAGSISTSSRWVPRPRIRPSGADPQSLGSRARARRLLRRQCRGGRGRRGGRHAGIGHRRIDPPTRGVVRRGGPEADVRAGLALRPDRVRVVARPDRARSRRCVEDAPSCSSAIAGHDPRDSTSFKARDPGLPRRTPRAAGGPWRLGIPRNISARAWIRKSARRVEPAIDHYRGLGCEIREVSLPHTQYCLDTYYIIATAEAPRTSPVTMAFGTAIARRRRRTRSTCISVPRRGLRPRGEAPDHPRHLRPLQRVLRRLLPARAEGPHPDPAGFSQRLPRGRRAHHADFADAGVQDRGEEPIRSRCTCWTSTRSG